MPSAGAAKTEQQRQLRARQAAHLDDLRNERDRLLEQVQELQQRVALAEVAQQEAIRTERDLRREQLRRRDAELDRLWGECAKMERKVY